MSQRSPITTMVTIVGLMGVALLVPLAQAATANACAAANVRYAGSSNILYVSGAVECTLTQIDALTSAPLTLVDPVNKVWYLGTNLKLENGATLLLHGSAVGGDVDQLRLKSEDSSASGAYIWVRGEWGTLDLRSTKVTSWKTSAGGPDTEHSTYKRAYVHVRSRLDADGVTALESRMNITDSDVGYLGFNGAEAYGLAWKVSGTTAGLFDKVNVYGDVTNSRLHHNYMGAYTYGAFGMRWIANELDNNVSYGLDPHDDSDSLLIQDNNSHDNGNHGIICSQRCDNLTIVGNTSSNNVGNGIMLHRNVVNTLVEDNDVSNNTDSGIAVFDSHDNIIRGNRATANKTGIRLSVGSARNLFESNVVDASTSYGIYFYRGSDAPTSGDGHPKLNRFVTNTVQNGKSNVIKLGDADDNTFEGNLFTNNRSGVLLERGLRNRISDTDMTSVANVATYGNSTAAASTYLSGFGIASVKVNSTSTTFAEDAAGRVFSPEERLATSITPTGSALTLSNATIGLASRVVSLTFLATLSSGSATVSPELWETSAARRKQWTTGSSVAGQSVAYVVGDLAPSTTYRVVADKKSVGVFTSDAAGTLSFEDALTRPSVTYAVEPS